MRLSAVGEWILYPRASYHRVCSSAETREEVASRYELLARAHENYVGRKNPHDSLLHKADAKRCRREAAIVRRGL